MFHVKHRQRYVDIEPVDLLCLKRFVEIRQSERIFIRKTFSVLSNVSRETLLEIKC